MPAGRAARRGGTLLRLGSGQQRTWVFNTWFLGRREIVNFRGLGSPKNHSKRLGASPPVFWNGFLGRRGRPNHPTSTISGQPKNHVLKTQQYNARPSAEAQGPPKGFGAPKRGQKSP